VPVLRSGAWCAVTRPTPTLTGGGHGAARAPGPWHTLSTHPDPRRHAPSREDVIAAPAPKGMPHRIHPPGRLAGTEPAVCPALGSADCRVSGECARPPLAGGEGLALMWPRASGWRWPPASRGGPLSARYLSQRPKLLQGYPCNQGASIGPVTSINRSGQAPGLSSGTPLRGGPIQFADSTATCVPVQRESPPCQGGGCGGPGGRSPIRGSTPAPPVAVPSVSPARVRHVPAFGGIPRRGSGTRIVGPAFGT
jgi:hypothetical protein